jgi:predicted nucleic acid-binding protein
MPTIPDSNVVLDLLHRDSLFFAWSRKWLEACATDGLVTNAVVFAESVVEFPAFDDAQSAFAQFGFAFEDISAAAAHRAGLAHRSYRTNGGRRERVLPDFLIGAHAVNRGYRILTRDASRYRSYFPEVEVIAPDSHP